MPQQPNPALVDVYRKNIIESCHRGSAIVVNHHGETVFSIGDTDRSIYPRSSLKFFQALPMVESGAADHFGVSDAEIALACASHSAEPVHTEAVRAWLERIGMGVEDLENGPALPLSDDMKANLYANREEPTRIHQNCSGKHTGMLTLAKFLGADTGGYSEHGHPVQKAWMTAFSELVDLDIPALEWERDGCGLPAICMPMKSLAYGCALFARPRAVGGLREKAITRIMSAIAAHPNMIAGTGRCCSDVIRETGGSVLVKTGAEAVYVGVIPEQGLGLAIKIDDGTTRGSEVALGALLEKLDALPAHAREPLARHFRPGIFNSQDFLTGEVVPSAAWDNL